MGISHFPSAALPSAIQALRGTILGAGSECCSQGSLEGELKGGREKPESGGPPPDPVPDGQRRGRNGSVVFNCA